MPDLFLSPSEAASRLGVSPKALRLYEQRGLIDPLRSAAGWRTYGPAQLEQAERILALRSLGLSLSGIAAALAGDVVALEAALAKHQLRLEAEAGATADAIQRLRELRLDLQQGRPLDPALLRRVTEHKAAVVSFDLPWPWGGERFELAALAPITFLTGPLGSGKTRLALRLADVLPGGQFLGLDRAPPPPHDRERLARLAPALAWLEEDGATISDALLALLSGLDASTGPLVVDLVEQGLDHATQIALIAYLRTRPTSAPPLVLMTRSTAILDLNDLRPAEAVLFCPANHAPPFMVVPVPGARGYEALASCLAHPDVRARTAGTLAMRLVPPVPTGSG